MPIKTLKKIFSFLLSFNLLFQGFSPLLAPVYADDSTPSATPIEEMASSSEIAPEPIPVEIPIVTPEITPLPTPDITPTIDIPNPPIAVIARSASDAATTEPALEPTGEISNKPSSNPDTQTPSQNNDSQNNTPPPTAEIEPIQAPQPSPIITSDKTDYFPTDIVNLSGVGFLPGAIYTLRISSSDIPTVSYNTSVTADGNGNIAYAYKLDGNYRPNYFIEAMDVSGAVVTTHAFTDSRNIFTIKVNGANSVTVAPNTSVNVSVTVNTNGILLANNWQSTKWRLGNGTWHCENTPDHFSSGSHTESFHIKAPPSQGIYNLTIRAYQFDFCLGNDDEKTLNDAIITVINSHAVTATAGPGGTISPFGLVTINDGDDHTFNITPNPGHIVSDVLVDSISLGRLNRYTFNNVTSDHIISASFDSDWYSADSFSNNGFSNPGTISISNNTYSTSNGSGESEILREFDIPSIPFGSTINGIEVAVEGKTSGRNITVSLSKNGGRSFDTITHTTSFSPTDKTVVLGGRADLWGQTWTPNSFTNSHFRLKVTSTSGGGTVSLDQIQVKVFYIETPTDTILPDTTIDSGITGVTSSKSATFTFFSTEPGTFECALDEGIFSVCITPKTYTELNEGNHIFQVRAKDLTDNIDASPASNTWTVDTTAPITPTASPSAGNYLTDQTVTLSSSDSNSGLSKIYYTTDGSDPNNTKTEYLTPILVDKDTTIKTIAYDKVGNASGVLITSYGIAPHISGETSTSINTTLATINWVTDDLSTSRVVYDIVSHPVLGSASNYDYVNSTSETDNLPKVVSHSVTLRGLTAGTTYYYRVISHGSPEAVGEERSFRTANIGGSGVSDGQAPTPSAPICSAAKPGSAPILLNAVAGFNNVTLTWSKALDPVTYYLITYGTIPGSQQYGNPNVGNHNVTSYTINGLSGGVKYYFKIRAGNDCAPGSYSNEISATPTGGVVTEPASGFAPGVLGVTTNKGGSISTDTASIVSPTPSVFGNYTNKNNWNLWWLLLLVPGYVVQRRLFKKK